ncbi:hypothetical protein ACP4OV_009650 [Aristida adscensionis]
MADSGAAGSSAGDHQSSYFDDLSGRFAGRYGSWLLETHSPQTQEQYELALESSQTYTCTRLALIFCEVENGEVLGDVIPLDSHMFRCRWVDPEDTRLCFHLNFRALAGGVLRFFFAEIIGTNCPQLVTMCVLVGGTGIRART